MRQFVLTPSPGQEAKQQRAIWTALTGCILIK